MAKAALNMMTRTAANSYAKLNIYMTAVDTGWITDENPLEQHKDRANNAPPPLDNVDAAMRVLDPVLLGVSDPTQRLYNVFLKDYKCTRW
jgi:NAD(P)-dependent dehydrogenase (short-subunit alcohol dehydrogenase family)